jgi:hypothetical protein
MLDSSRHRLETRPLHAACDFTGDSGGGDIHHVAGKVAYERVANGPSDDPCLFTRGIERRKDFSERRLE